MADPVTTIMLVVTIITGEGKQDITHRQAEDSVEECITDLRAFLKSHPPRSVEAKKLGAGCIVALSDEEGG